MTIEDVDRIRKKRKADQILERQERFDRLFPESEPGRTAAESRATRLKALNPPQSWSTSKRSAHALMRAHSKARGLVAIGFGPARFVHPKELARRRRRDEIAFESRRRNRGTR